MQATILALKSLTMEIWVHGYTRFHTMFNQILDSAVKYFNEISLLVIDQGITFIGNKMLDIQVLGSHSLS